MISKRKNLGWIIIAVFLISMVLPGFSQPAQATNPLSTVSITPAADAVDVPLAAAVQDGAGNFPQEAKVFSFTTVSGGSAEAWLDVNNSALKTALGGSSSINLNMKNITFDRAELSIDYDPAMSIVTANAWCPGVSDDPFGPSDTVLENGWHRSTFKIIGKNDISQVVGPLTIEESGDSVYKITFTNQNIEGTVPVSLGVGDESTTYLKLKVYYNDNPVPITVPADTFNIIPGTTFLSFTNKAHIAYAVDYATRAPIGNGSIQYKISAADSWQTIDTDNLSVDSAFGGYFFNSPAEATKDTAYQFLADGYPVTSIDKYTDWTWNQSLYHYIFTLNSSNGGGGHDGIYLPYQGTGPFTSIFANEPTFTIPMIDVQVPIAMGNTVPSFKLYDQQSNLVAESGTYAHYNINTWEDINYHMFDGVNMTCINQSGLTAGVYQLKAVLGDQQSNAVMVQAVDGPLFCSGVEPYWITAGSQSFSLVISGYKVEENLSSLTADLSSVSYDSNMNEVLTPLNLSTPKFILLPTDSEYPDLDQLQIDFAIPSPGLSKGDYRLVLSYNGNPVSFMGNGDSLDFKATEDSFISKISPSTPQAGSDVKVYGNNLSNKTFNIYMYDVGLSPGDPVATDLTPVSVEGGGQYLEFTIPSNTADGTYTLYAVDTTTKSSIMGNLSFDIGTTNPEFIAVSAIAVTGTANATTITADKGTLQMSAVILPTDATDKAVAWTVENETGSATISSAGLLTAVGNGDVTVKATANDGSGIVGSKIITISGQLLAAPSTNAKLATLTTTVGTLVPAFDPTVTSYTLSLPSSYAGAIGTVNTAIAATKADTTAGDPVITPATDFGQSVVVAVTAQSGATKTYSIKIEKRPAPIVVTVGTEAAPAETSPDMTTASNIELNYAAADAAKAKVILTVPADVNNASFTVPVTAGVATVPNIEVTAPKTGIGSVTVEIQAGTTITGPATWDGTITLPSVRDVAAITETTVGADTLQTVSSVIEIGLGDQGLTFDKPVRILLPGQAGKEVGIKRGAVLTKVTSTLSADTQAAADATLVGAVTDAKITAGSDAIVWTNHFTEFFTYTAVTSNSGSGGGGGAAVYAGITVTASGATVTRYDAAVKIPANALSSSAVIKIEKTTASGLNTATGQSIVSDVYNITKTGTTAFIKPVTVTLAYTTSAIDANETVSLYVYDESADKWVELSDIVVDKTSGKISGATTTLGKFAIVATATQKEVEEGLSDIKDHWAEATINTLVSAGAITGYPDGTFKPNNTITRAEFATVLVKAFKLKAATGKTFADTANHWAKDAIATAAANSIVNGYNDSTFGPNDQITREQMAVMIVRAKNLSASTASVSFTDKASVSDWAVDAVAAANANGYITGYPDNSFKPLGNTTRAEAATVIVKSMK